MKNESYSDVERLGRNFDLCDSGSDWLGSMPDYVTSGKYLNLPDDTEMIDEEFPVYNIKDLNRSPRSGASSGEGSVKNSGSESLLTVPSVVQLKFEWYE